MHILQLATVARCCDSLKFAFASRHAEKKNDRKEQVLIQTHFILRLDFSFY